MSYVSTLQINLAKFSILTFILADSTAVVTELTALSIQDEYDETPPHHDDVPDASGSLSFSTSFCSDSTSFWGSGVLKEKSDVDS